MVAKFLGDNLSQFKTEAICYFLRKIRMGAAAKNLNIRHFVASLWVVVRHRAGCGSEKLSSQREELRIYQQLISYSLPSRAVSLPILHYVPHLARAAHCRRARARCLRCAAMTSSWTRELKKVSCASEVTESCWLRKQMEKSREILSVCSCYGLSCFYFFICLNSMQYFLSFVRSIELKVMIFTLLLKYAEGCPFWSSFYKPIYKTGVSFNSLASQYGTHPFVLCF